MKRQPFYWIFFFIIFSSCLENPVMTTGIVNRKENPTVQTGEKITPKDGSLFFQGIIVAKGKSNIITEKGFYWSTVSTNPDKNDNIVVASDADDIFTSELKGVAGEKTYYWRAYAKNEYGYDYGEVKSYETPKIWQEKAQFPANSRGQGASFVLNQKLYITCGVKAWGQVLVNETWEYTLSDNQWREVREFMGENRKYPVAFTIGTLAYVGTGLQASAVVHKNFFQYNNLVNEWTKIDDNEEILGRNEAVAFSLNGKGYLVGGMSAGGNSMNDVWQFTPTGGGDWKRMNNFPSRFSGGIAISNNKRAFAGLGDDSESKKTLWEYDAETDNWEEFVKLPDEIIKKIYSGVIIQNTIYIVDGDNIIWALNLADRTWKKKTELPSEFLNEEGEAGNQLLFIFDNSNSIFVGLGFTGYFFEYRVLWDN